MNKTTEALKLAEEALYNTGNALMCLTTTRNLRPMYQEMRDDAVEGCNKALAAIREALAEPVQEHESREDIAAKEMFEGFSKAWAAPEQQAMEL